MPGLDQLYPEIGERDAACMRLYADKTGVAIDARRISSDGVVIAADKTRRLLIVQPDDVGLSADFDFVTMPLPRRESLGVLVLLLAGPGAHLFDFVNRAGVAEESAVLLIGKPGVAPGFFVDLNFKPSVHRDKGRIIGRIDWIRRRIGQARIAKTYEDAGVVVVRTERMREQKIEPEDEVFEGLRLVEEQADSFPILLRDHHSLEERKPTAAGHSPVRKLRFASVE